MPNAFGSFNPGGAKMPGEMPAPVKQAPMAGGRGGQVPSLGGAGGATSFQPPQTPQLDEFGRDPSAFLGSTKTPMAAVPDFNQRKANAAMMMPSAGAPPPQSMPGTGGPLMAGPQPFPPGPPQQADPPQGGPGRMPPQQFPQQRGPMPYDPQGGFGSGAGAGQMPGAFRGQNTGQDQAGAMQPPPGFQQMMQNPGFMQWLQKMFAGQGGGMQGGGGPTPGGLPAQQAGPMTQGLPR